jgi:polyphosphate kinase 2 (PPK2 family)
MSKAEQRKRLLSRCEDPDKNWKVTPDDIRDHRLYSRYRSAYEQAIAATSTAEAPWYVIPADDKRTARILISQIMVEQLDRLPLRFPRANSEQKQLIAEARRQLKSR